MKTKTGLFFKKYRESADKAETVRKTNNWPEKYCNKDNMLCTDKKTVIDQKVYHK